MVNIETIPKGAKYIMDRLIANGYEAWLVGGCVRDMLMEVTPKDWDICTDAYPEVVQAMFELSNTVIPTGIKHGTVTIMVSGVGYEVTTFRIDGKYSDGRRPDTIRYAKSLAEDLSRRDFTINALAYNYNAGVVDLYGGINDINHKIIRCVGKPEDRFNEDSLRILRALRFASTKGFSLDKNTDKAIRKMYTKMAVLSAERVLSEISKLLVGDGVFNVLMDYPEVFTFLMPELSAMVGCKQNNPHHKYDVWEHTCRVVAGVPKDEVLRFAALFHDAGKPDCKVVAAKGIDRFMGHPGVSAEKAVSILKRLKSSNDLIDKVSILVKYHDVSLPNKSKCKTSAEYDVRELVYYIDYNYFDGNSLKQDPRWEFKSEQVSFKNYWVKTGEVKNREPKKHKEITEKYKTGEVLKLWNAGTATYLYRKEQAKEGVDL